MIKSEQFYALCLIRTTGIGIKKLSQLLSIYGSYERAYNKLSETKILVSEKKIEFEVQQTEAFGARYLFLDEDIFPQSLKSISDPPPVLVCLGNQDLLFHERRLAVVGARNASYHAQLWTRQILSHCVDQFLIVSGLAKGIDTCAHQAARKESTVAVIAGGINNIYPHENKKLYEEIAQEGLIITEAGFGASPKPKLFLKRNRLIAGLSQAVFIIEAAKQSGSLSTARFARENGREVLAAPGAPFDPKSAGCNQLIKDGAQLIQDYEDIVFTFQNLRHSVQEKKIPQRKNEEKKQSFSNSLLKSEKKLLHSDQGPVNLTNKILNHLTCHPIFIDDFIHQLQEDDVKVTRALTELEMTGRIIRHVGNFISLPMENTLNRKTI